MGVHEVSRLMIEVYNEIGVGPQIAAGGSAYQPARGVSWNGAARFVNWLNTSKGFSEAYKFTTLGGNDNIELWQAGDPGFDAANPFRNRNAHYFLPSEDEWYKAAYYDPAKNSGAGGYWDYATGSDTAPTAVAGGTASGTAVYNQTFATGPADITNAGGLSPYGTMAQNGNVWEWNETALYTTNDPANDERRIRGGGWNVPDFVLSSSYDRRSADTYPDRQDPLVGFRVAAVPEPSVFFLAVLGMTSFVVRRQRESTGFRVQGSASPR